VLLCIRDLANKYGLEFERRYSGQAYSNPGAQMMGQGSMALSAGPGGGSSLMYDYIANLFYFGFRKPLIEALK
jgi:hypothetical protein